MKLEEITSGASLEGVEPANVVTVVAAIPLPPSSLQLVYRLPDGALRERLLSRDDESSLKVATTERPWSFDGDGATFQLTAEAKRIDLAHNGKAEDFQLFLSLLDSDRFYGKFRDDAHKVDTSDVMRRMVKEDLVKFDGTPLFPKRHAYTLNYKLSDLEEELYRRVTTYVKEEMGKADDLDGQRRGSIGFALTTLQRRLASSPEAIYQSLDRRHSRLQQRLREEKLGSPQRSFGELFTVPKDDDDLTAGEQEQLEEKLADDASASDGDAVEGAFYLRSPFVSEPVWGLSSVNFDAKARMARAELV